MPSYTAVFEDTSPFFIYDGQWRAGTSRDDDFADQYSESSFTLTERTGSTFSFTFYGTGVGIYGARRGNHGFYQVTVDGSTVLSQSGRADPFEFNATLYSATLTKGFHRVQLRNTDNSFRDIDYVSWEASVGQDNEPLIVNVIQDSHPAWTYTPELAWTTQPPDVAAFSGGSGRGTNQVGATASLTFTGDAIAIYGPSGPNCASQYTVSVNTLPGGQTFRAEKQFFRARQLMYYAANLGPGTHVINVTLAGLSNGQPLQMLSLDYAEIYTTPSLGGSFSAIGGSSRSSSDQSVGLFVGLGLTAALSVLSLALLAYIFYLFKIGRIRKATRSDLDQYVPAAAMSPANVPQYYGAEPLSLPPVVSQPSMQFQSHPQYDRDSHYPTSFPQPSRSTGLTDHSHDRSRGQSSSDALSGNGTFMTTSSNPIISTYSKGQRQPSRPISEAPPPAYNVATP